MDKPFDMTRYILAIKGGKVVYKAKDSRQMAEYLKPEHTASVETIARSIRRCVNNDVLYGGYLFVEV